MSLLAAFRNCARRSPRWIRVTCNQPLVSPVSHPPHDIKHGVNFNPRRHLSSMNPNDFIAASLIDSVTFETVCSDTLESLCDYFEHLVEEASFLKSADIIYGDGVLTVNLGKPYGTYVINRQSPNRQIWLSSPTSGPKRYDFIPEKSAINEGYWVYKHDGVSLHELLQEEIGHIVQKEVDFLSLPHSKRVK
ncbi:frataxin homolog, mitochondrial [Ochlerotatus camptorhynchus]|uniref:frataxin homolog, mitochondrial n=1 Tax=Ochlerotatus camptorhynchus TaxID=644619 RepID=UPI0031D96747